MSKAYKLVKSIISPFRSVIAPQPIIFRPTRFVSTELSEYFIPQSVSICHPNLYPLLRTPPLTNFQNSIRKFTQTEGKNDPNSENERNETRVLLQLLLILAVICCGYNLVAIKSTRISHSFLDFCIIHLKILKFNGIQRGMLTCGTFLPSDHAKRSSRIFLKIFQIQVKIQKHVILLKNQPNSGLLSLSKQFECAKERKRNEKGADLSEQEILDIFDRQVMASRVKEYGSLSREDCLSTLLDCRFLKYNEEEWKEFENCMNECLEEMKMIKKNDPLMLMWHPVDGFEENLESFLKDAKLLWKNRKWKYVAGIPFISICGAFEKINDDQNSK